MSHPYHQHYRHRESLRPLLPAWTVHIKNGGDVDQTERLCWVKASILLTYSRIPIIVNTATQGVVITCLEAGGERRLGRGLDQVCPDSQSRA